MPHAGSLAAACTRDLVPRPGIEPGSPALGAQSLSHWTTREVPRTESKSLFVAAEVQLQPPISSPRPLCPRQPRWPSLSPSPKVTKVSPFPSLQRDAACPPRGLLRGFAWPPSPQSRPGPVPSSLSSHTFHKQYLPSLFTCLLVCFLSLI